MPHEEEELLDYSDSEEIAVPATATAAAAAPAADAEELNDDEALPIKQEASDKKGSYVGIHSTGFRDFLLKPELLRAIVDCGFEHPSEGKWRQKKKPTWQSLTCFFSAASLYSSVDSRHRCALPGQVRSG